MRRFFRYPFLLSGLAAVVLLAAPAAAQRPFGNHDLRGEYLFTVVEVHRVMLPGGGFALDHCSIAGAASFDGAGTMTLDAVQRCSFSGSGASSGTQYYAVNADGSFLISESPDMADPVHGQIVDKGRSLLLDGTLRTLPELLSWSGIAMKR